MSDVLLSEFTIPANHPALAGHFPGQPVVPGVVLLDAIYAAIRAIEPLSLRAIPVVKFRKPVLPDERIEVRLQFAAVESAAVRVDFQGLHGASVVFEGSLILTGGTS
jgi:3-hydroxyacyl-[acyl-carrier-protein] dehydratase